MKKKMGRRLDYVNLALEPIGENPFDVTSLETV